MLCSQSTFQVLGRRQPWLSLQPSPDVCFPRFSFANSEHSRVHGPPWLRCKITELHACARLKRLPKPGANLSCIENRWTITTATPPTLSPCQPDPSQMLIWRRESARVLAMQDTPCYQLQPTICCTWNFDGPWQLHMGLEVGDRTDPGSAFPSYGLGGALDLCDLAA